MKICVIGGSGFVGSHLIKSLKKKHEILVIDKVVNPDFKEITLKLDIRDPEFLKTDLDGFDLVIHLAAEHRDDVSPASLYYDVNVEGTRNILKVMEDNSIEHILFTSSVAIYGLDKDSPDEDFKPDPFNDYGTSKWQAEEVLREWYNKQPEKRTLSIVRPSVIFGEENRGNVYNLLDQIVKGRFMMVGKGNNRKSMAYVGNVVSFVEYLIENGKRYEVFNYTDTPDLTTKQLIDVIEKSLHIKTPPIRVPYSVGLMGGYFFDLLAKVTGKKLPISSIRVKKFCASTQVNALKAHQSGFVPSYSIQDGLKQTLLYEFSD